jgi:hypothetical protein
LKKINLTLYVLVTDFLMANIKIKISFNAARNGGGSSEILGFYFV